MFFNKINKEKLERLLPDIEEGIDVYEWSVSFPSVIGYEYFLPQSFEEANLYKNVFRNNDQLLAVKLADYSEFHNKMVEIINRIIDLNTESKMWDAYDDMEYPGISFAYALALQDIKYLELYSAFLISIKPNFHVKYLKYDIVTLIQKWQWNSRTYHLLLIYWFSNNKEKIAVLNYLYKEGFGIDLVEAGMIRYVEFITALELFLFKQECLHNELLNEYQTLFNDLVDEYIFPEETEKAEQLKNHFPKAVEKLTNKWTAEPELPNMVEAHISLEEDLPEI